MRSRVALSTQWMSSKIRICGWRASCRRRRTVRKDHVLARAGFEQVREVGIEPVGDVAQGPERARGEKRLGPAPMDPCARQALREGPQKRRFAGPRLARDDQGAARAGLGGPGGALQKPQIVLPFQEHVGCPDRRAMEPRCPFQAPSTSALGMMRGHCFAVPWACWPIGRTRPPRPPASHAARSASCGRVSARR